MSLCGKKAECKGLKTFRLFGLTKGWWFGNLFRCNMRECKGLKTFGLFGLTKEWCSGKYLSRRFCGRERPDWEGSARRSFHSFYGQERPLAEVTKGKEPFRIFFLVFFLGFFPCFSDRSYLGFISPLADDLLGLMVGYSDRRTLFYPFCFEPSTIYVLQFYREVIDSGLYFVAWRRKRRAWYALRESVLILALTEQLL
jgi:hypothetical protein